ncbi:hypothetical protein BABINDRAFT_161810 [Babjeviella inositovora NRRL Y-12698]|uniref:Urea active transporter n=1 Tax=Babjeviella inositovora NRRL Y-12698 TaxID=984486 RepID=A0A1E3QP44_9ASCO|nr:uncharacterized protein BABINDRAFT_161810 [Babjeviella inositovora NRRL Y-12698]ODQ79408.1 hypothetical protein BABINDRAFT_161810 [Babjeviella inositovora NRRL Y-12698]
MSDAYVPLSQGVGYGVVVGLGAAFAIGMILTTSVLRRYQREIITAEEFATAGRSVKTGLISAAVVSSWTWAATLLQSTSQAYKNGVSGPFFYAAGATVQIVLFACLAIKAKQKAPQAHTYLEIVKARYGVAAHSVYMFFGLATNILVTAMLLTGGSAVVNDLTGMHVVAACFLLPLGTVVYTLFGGIKATFLTDYVHTVIIVVIILIFAFTTYATNNVLGSPSVVYDKLVALASETPVVGNAEGSYLTLKSRSGGIFFVINIVGNFGTVFLDNGYWNKAIASSPASALPGYVLGGLAWFAVPFLTATTMGLAGLCLESDPSWPTYPNRLTPDQVSAGLVLPNAAVALLGKGGAVCSLLLIFMAVTSAMSAELIAVSSIFTYDIYRPYVNPNASGKRLIMISHASVVGFALIMAAFSTGLYYAGVSMGYLYELMGTIIGGAVLPAALTLLWGKQNAISVIVAPIGSTLLAIMAWLVCTKAKFKWISVDNTFEDDAMLTGNLVALLTPCILVPILTYSCGPQNFDWNILKNIKRVDETTEIIEATEKYNSPDVEASAENNSDHSTAEVKTELETHAEDLHPVKSVLGNIALDVAVTRVDEIAKEEALLKRSAKIAGIICITLTLCLLILWPMPMYGTGYVFSKKFFTGWVCVGIIWIFFTAGMVCVYPIYEARHGIFTLARGIYWDLTGQSWKLRAWQTEHPEELHVVKSQIETELHREGGEMTLMQRLAE